MNIDICQGEDVVAMKALLFVPSIQNNLNSIRTDGVPYYSLYLEPLAYNLTFIYLSFITL